MILVNKMRKSCKHTKNLNQFFTPTFVIQVEDEHHFRKPANDITSQLEINFGDLGRPGRGRGGPRGGGRGGRGRGEASRPVRGGRTDKVDNVMEAQLSYKVTKCLHFCLI